MTLICRCDHTKIEQQHSKLSMEKKKLKQGNKNVFTFLSAISPLSGLATAWLKLCQTQKPAVSYFNCANVGRLALFSLQGWNNITGS